MNPRSRWKEVAAVLKALEDDPEQLRRMILGYASAVLLNGAENGRAGLILTVFRNHNYDCGKPGLVQQCYEVYSEK